MAGIGGMETNGGTPPADTEGTWKIINTGGEGALVMTTLKGPAGNTDVTDSVYTAPIPFSILGLQNILAGFYWIEPSADIATDLVAELQFTYTGASAPSVYDALDDVPDWTAFAEWQDFDTAITWLSGGANLTAANSDKYYLTEIAPKLESTSASTVGCFCWPLALRIKLTCNTADLDAGAEYISLCFLLPRSVVDPASSMFQALQGYKEGQDV